MFKSVQALVVLLIVLGTVLNTTAQSNSMGALYFQNRYLGNPAIAGSTPGLNVSIGYKTQWSEIPGSPTLQTLTAEYAATVRVGLGINIYSDQAGIFRRTRAVATYSYHLPLNHEGRKISFGLSFGLMADRLNSGDIEGDINDINLINYDNREMYADGDFGISYAGGNFNIQASVSNLKDYLKKDVIGSSIDHSIFFSALSYRIQLSQVPGNFDLEPKVCYRDIKGFENVLDAGANLSYADNRLNFFGMYHSQKNATVGLGFSHLAFQISGMYTTATPNIGGYTNGNFEIGLKLKLIKASGKER
jgi:type IX secretion system PorP/SprF family membrane protein